MFSAIRASISGVHAASRSMSARADNIANIRTTARVDEVSRAPAPNDGVFRPYGVVRIARDSGGVDTVVRPVEPSHRVTRDPGDPKSDVDGLVAAPNVTLEEELAGIGLDRHQLAANLAVIRTEDEMLGMLFDEEV
jgi:flagellar basal body rod protein FlgC